MRSWLGFRAISERAALSTPARGGASREGIVSPWCWTENSPLGRSTTSTGVPA